VLAAAVFSIVMLTWKRGRRIYREQVVAISPSLSQFIGDCRHGAIVRSPGAGVFVTGQSTGVPPVVLNLMSRMRVLPETIVLLTVEVVHTPHVGRDAMRVDRLGEGFFRLVIERGFMDSESVPLGLARAITRFRLPLSANDVTYYIGRETFLATKAGQMGPLGERLFDFLSRNAKSAADHFDLPPERVVEIGTKIDL
jgi:KUP system potassium uptake protein